MESHNKKQQELNEKFEELGEEAEKIIADAVYSHGGQLKASSLRKAAESFGRIVQWKLAHSVDSTNTSLRKVYEINSWSGWMVWGFDTKSGNKKISFQPKEGDVGPGAVQAICDKFTMRYNSWCKDTGCEASFLIQAYEDKAPEIKVSTITMPIYTSEEATEAHLQTLMDAAKEEGKAEEKEDPLKKTWEVRTVTRDGLFAGAVEGSVKILMDVVPGSHAFATRTEDETSHPEGVSDSKLWVHLIPATEEWEGKEDKTLKSMASMHALTGPTGLTIKFVSEADGKDKPRLVGYTFVPQSERTAHGK